MSNVVFMGMGEPMANYNAVIGAVRRLTDKTPDGLGMSARGITVSTVGLVPRMKQLADEGIPVTLALSLHAPDDELRNELVPINTRFSVARDCRGGLGLRAEDQATGLGRVRHDARHQRPGMASRPARRRTQLLRQDRWGWVHVNLIPLNPTPGSKWTASATRRTSGSSSAGSRPRASPRPSGTRAVARSTVPAVSWPPSSPERLRPSGPALPALAGEH